MRFSQTHSRGHALAEFLIVTSLVLLPLFTVLPLLTRFFEAAQANRAVAHYTAWERTVFLAEAPFKAQSRIASKSAEQLHGEAISRILQPHGKPLDVAASNGNAKTARLSALPMLSAPHKGGWLYGRGSGMATRTNVFHAPGNSRSPVQLTSAQTALNSYGQATKDKVLSALQGKFDHNAHGLIHAESSYTLRSADWHPWLDKKTVTAAGTRKDALFLLTDSWKAADHAHQREVVRDLIPASWLTDHDESPGLFSKVIRAFSIAIPWFEPLNRLELGRIDVTQVPEQRSYTFGGQR